MCTQQLALGPQAAQPQQAVGDLMNTLALIEDYINNNSVSSAIDNALWEASLCQIKKQKPWFKDLIDLLKKEKVANKYIPWIVAVIDDREKSTIASIKKDYSTRGTAAGKVWNSFLLFPEYKMAKRSKTVSLRSMPHLIGGLVGLALRYEEADKAKRWDKAIKMGLFQNSRVKDIMFWSKKNVKTQFKSGDSLDVLSSALDRISTLKSRKEIKVSDADLIHRDDRFVIYSPRTKRASCQLGAGTKWCIASRQDDYFEDYTEKGVAFAFIMDSAAGKDMEKIAVVYDINTRSIDEYYDVIDDSIPEKEVKDSVGDANWKKLKPKILSYMKTRKLDIKRKEGDYWAGDQVEYDTQINDSLWNRLYDEVKHYWLDPWRFKSKLPSTDPPEFRDDGLENEVHEALHDIFSGASGVIIAPTRTNVDDTEPMVDVEGELDSDAKDWKEIAEEYFPIPDKPKEPGQKDISLDKGKGLRDQYLIDLEAYNDAVMLRKAFEKEVVKPIKALRYGKWKEEIHVFDLSITMKIDPAKSIEKYGPV